jgi:hypothetical protein
MNENANATAQEQPPRRRRFATVIGIGILLVVVGFVVFQVAFDVPHENEFGLRGGLSIVVDPNVDVYVGDEYVRTGSIDLTWDELLGTPELPPLARSISNDAPSPHMNQMGGVTAEALAGENAEIVWARNGMAGKAHNYEPIAFAWKQVLVKRQNGDLDYIDVLDAEFPGRKGRWQRFLIPLRFRSTDESEVYFSDGPSGGISSRSSGIPLQMGSFLRLRFSSKSEAPPDAFAEQINENGLWKPSK